MGSSGAALPIGWIGILPYPNHMVPTSRYTDAGLNRLQLHRRALDKAGFKLDVDVRWGPTPPSRLDRPDDFPT